MAIVKWICLAACGLGLGGCDATPAVFDAMHALSAPGASASTSAGALRLNLRQITAVTAAHHYHTAYVENLDWELAEATLTNTDATIPTLDQTASAVVDASDNRTASLLFSPIKPASSYTLSLSLKRRDATGAYQVVASGTSTNVTLAQGANSVTVTVTPTPQGQMLIDVSKPAVGLNTATTTVNTRSYYSIVRAAGDAIGGDGAGTSPTTASFKEISGVASDASGTLYVADAGNNQIRMVPSSGAAVLMAGSASGVAGITGDGGAATSAMISTPRGLSRDPSSGNLIFCDSGNNRVRVITGASGNIYTVAGGGSNAANSVPYAVNAQLNQPFGVCADQNGNFFVTERGTGRVLRIDASGALTTLATLPANSLGPIAIDRNDNLLWVGQGANVCLISGINSGAPTLAGAPVYTATGAGSPYVTGLAYDQIGTLYVAQAGDGATVGTTNVSISRLAVSNAGLLESGRSPEVIAGTGGSTTGSAAYALPTSVVTNATTQLLTGVNWCALTIDMSAGLSNTTESGVLYAGNSYSGTYGEVGKLIASPL